MRRWLTSWLFLACTAFPAQAEPVLKIVNFTADWCPPCQILNSRLEEATAAFPAGSIARVDLDMTKARHGSTALEAAAAHTDAINTADTHKAGYLWNWYGGVTGIAVVIAADNGEPINCFMGTLETQEIADRLTLAKILAERGTPGQRKPNGPDCPPPMDS